MRPRIESLLYFPHDVGAHDESEKIEPLMSIHGLAGYAHYFILLEMIYSTQKGALDISQPEKRKLIARKMFTSVQRFEKILEDELRFGLFDRQLYQDKGILTSTGISRRREKILHERTRKRRGYTGVIPGEIPEEYSHNDGERGGKGKGKRKRKGKGGREAGGNPRPKSY